MPFNRTGKPDQGFNSQPAGCLYLSELDNLDRPTGLRDMMAVTTFNGTPNSEFAEAYSTCGEVRVLEDRSAVQTDLQIDMTVRSILDTHFQAIVHSGSISRAATAGGLPLSVYDAGFVSPFTDAADADNGFIRFPNPGWAHAGAGVTAGYDDHEFANRRHQLWVNGEGVGKTLNAGGLEGYTPRKHAYNVDGSLIYVATPNAAQAGEELLHYADRTETYDAPGGNLTDTMNTTNFEVVEHAGQLWINGGGELARQINLYFIDPANVGKAFNSFSIGTDQTTTSGDLVNMSRINALTRTTQSFMGVLVGQDRRRRGYRRVFTFPKLQIDPSGTWEAISDSTDFATQDLTLTVQKPTWATDEDPFYYIDETRRGG